MTRARDLANIADGTFTATDLDLSGTLTVSGDANFDSGTLFVDVSANNVGIGTSSPSEQLHIANANDAVILVESTGIDATDDANIQLKTTNGTFTVQNDRSIGTSGALTFAGNTSNNIVIDHNSGNVGIGTSSPTTKLTVASATFEDHILVERTGVGSMHITATNPHGLAFTDGTTQFVTLVQSTGNFGIGTAAPVGAGTALNVRGPSAGLTIGSVVAESYDGVGHITLYSGIGGTDLPSIVYPSIGLRFGAGSKTTSSYAEKMRLDASGNLLVGTTTTRPDNGTGNTGIQLDPSGSLRVGRAGDCMILNRQSTDGAIVYFRKDGTDVGQINAFSGTLAIGGPNSGVMFNGNGMEPTSGGNTRVDGTENIGAAAWRFKDIYATNGTIQTSDANEKQDIAELDEAERRVAVACKGLLRKFRWKDAVAEKGDDARIHFGIIAQDLQAAFEAEGLDAGRYAMFIHSTWTDEETGEERSRMGVRYSELLAFIIAAL